MNNDDKGSDVKATESTIISRLRYIANRAWYTYIMKRTWAEEKKGGEEIHLGGRVKRSVVETAQTLYHQAFIYSICTWTWNNSWPEDLNCYTSKQYLDNNNLIPESAGNCLQLSSLDPPLYRCSAINDVVCKLVQLSTPTAALVLSSTSSAVDNCFVFFFLSFSFLFFLSFFAHSVIRRPAMWHARKPLCKPVFVSLRLWMRHLPPFLVIFFSSSVSDWLASEKSKRKSLISGQIKLKIATEASLSHTRLHYVLQGNPGPHYPNTLHPRLAAFLAMAAHCQLVINFVSS